MGFNQFMTITSYVFGLGMAFYILRNPQGLIQAIRGVWDAGSSTIGGLSGLPGLGGARAA